MFELPPEAATILTKIQVITGGTIVSISCVMGMLAGLMRTLGLREEGKRRYKDAIIGMAMVLTAPFVFFSIATIIKLFFPMRHV